MPENTLAAFRRSIARGVPIIELDLRVTRDGELVVLHDARSTARPTAPARSPRWRWRGHACDAGGGERCRASPRSLALVRGTPVRILADVKDGTPLAPVLEAVREQHAERQVILGLRRVNQVARARAALPDTTILAFMPRVADAPAFATAGAHIIRLWSDWVEADPALVARSRALGPQVWMLVGRHRPRTQSEWRALHGRMLAARPGRADHRPARVDPQGGAMTAGYSGTPLALKLDLKHGLRVWWDGMPDSVARRDCDPRFAVGAARRTAKRRSMPRTSSSPRAATLEAKLHQLLPRLAPAGMIWVSWPKKASKVPTDITEDVIREICLPMGLVDVKVCAVDATWSGLKLVVRRQNRDVRPQPAGPA